MPHNATTASQLAEQAESMVNNLVETKYQYEPVVIDPGIGVYKSDCSAFVDFVLNEVAPQHYAAIQKLDEKPWPRAFAYCDYFLGLGTEANSEWMPVASLMEAQRGDIVAWKLHEAVEPGEDTGHVFFVAEAANLLDSDTIAVRVYDSANTPHFDDTRGGQIPNGVGSGFINFQGDGREEPPTIQFGIGDEPFTPFQFAIGRVI